MAVTVEQVGAPELMWDLSRILRCPTNTDAAYAAGTTLVPTAVNPACFALDWANKFSPFIYRITFGSTVGIGWSLYIAASGLGLTPFAVLPLGNTPGGGFTVFRAQVAAAPVALYLVDGGRATANTYTTILSGSWMKFAFNGSLVLATTATAGTVTASFQWAEYAF